MTWRLDRSPSTALCLVMIMTFVDMFAVGCLLPVLPEVILHLTGGQAAGAAKTLALIIAVFSGTQFLAAPLLGTLSDRFGRVPLFLLMLACGALNNLAIAFAPSLGILFATHVIAGLTSAKMAVAGAFIADVSPPNQRSRHFGLLGMSVSLGFVLGPAAGGLLATLGLHVPYVVAASLQTIAFMFVLVAVPETLAVDKRRAAPLGQLLPWRALRMLLATKILRTVAVIVFLYGFAAVIFQSMWLLYASHRFGWGPVENGITLAGLGILMAASQMKLVPYLCRRFGEWRTVMIGLSAGAASFAVLSMAQSVWHLAIFSVLYAIGSCVLPASRALASGEVAPNQQGGAQGALASLSSLDALIAPALASTLFGYAATSHRYADVFAISPFLLATGVLAMALAFCASAIGRLRLVNAPQQEQAT